MLPTKFQLTDDGRQMPIDGKSSHCLWQGELKTNCSSLPNTPYMFSVQKSLIRLTIYNVPSLISIQCLYIIELEYS